MELTDKQVTLWKELGSDYSAPPHLCQQTLEFYQTYKQHESFSVDRADLILKVAFFLAEKSQVLYDRQGRKLKSIAISANSILRDHPKHQQFLYHLLQMVRVIQIPAQASHLEEDVASFSRHFSSSLTFLNKLKTTLRKIRVNKKTQDTPEHQEQVSRLIWLLFIQCRSQLNLGIDIIENTCLMSCILGYYLLQKYQEDGVFSIYFQHDNEGCTLSNQPDQLSCYLMAYFHIKDKNTYLDVYDKMMDYLESQDKNINLKKVFHSQCISKHIYLVQKLYEKGLGDGRLDESTFFRGNNVSHQPVARITPFGRRAPLAPRTANALSHRVLNFENVEQINEKNVQGDPSKKQQKAGLHLFGKIKFQPTPKGTLIRATPMSQAMQAYNWLYQRCGRFQLNKEEIYLIQQTFQAFLSEQGQDSQKDRYQLVGGLWKQAVQRNEELNSRTLLLVSVNIVTHVLNVSTNDIGLVMSQLDISSLEVWEALDYLINRFDKQMPLSLKIHLLTLQTTFISHRLWNREKHLLQLQTEHNLYNSRLSKRVIYQGAYLLHLLAKKLELYEEIADSGFLIFQQTIQFQTGLLYQNLLQHVVVCSLYAASKVKDHSLKFNQILAAVREVLGLAVGPFNELVEGVKIQDKKENIIIYYNSVFVPSIRLFLRQLRNTSSLQISPGIMSNKLREVVVREATALSSPQMANYFAYCESPMLKNKPLREININNNGVSSNLSTVKREKVYNMQDIEAKFGKNGGNTLRQTRKFKC